MVHREVFDNFLVEQARNRGAILKDETEVTGLAPSAAGWTVSARDGQFQARYLIAADGAKGMAAVWLGFRERLRKKAAALEAEIPRTQAPEPVLDINMFDNFTGYAWRFPKSCSNSVGIGTWQSASVGLRQLLEGYVRSHDLPMAKASVFGHPLLLWDGDQALHTERALLAGEAGCMVDPFSGEGIRFAMRTGVLAAAAIGDALNGQASALPQYSDRVQKELGSEMKLARALTSVFYTPDIGTREQAIRHPARADLFARLTCGGITYQKFFVATALLNLLVPLSSSRTRAESASA
jgi:flavin-dependent dehydrogenase